MQQMSYKKWAWKFRLQNGDYFVSTAAYALIQQVLLTSSTYK